MNKYQEPFNNIVVEAELMAERCNHKLEKDIKTVQELIDKATPKKPTYVADGYSEGELVFDTWVCPNCDEDYEVDYHYYDYCPNCGQAIDWSEEE